MGEFIVRLSSLTLQNIKNVKKGTVFMPMANEKSLNVGGAEILGIYGQNGSGKTAVVDGLYFLQQIMIGETIDQSISDYIGVDDDAAHMNAEFKIFGKKKIYEVGYNIELKKMDGDVVIEREFLNCAINQDGKERIRIFSWIIYAASRRVFLNHKRLDRLIGKDKERRTDLIVARKMAEKSNCSFIFGDSSREIFCQKVEDKFKNYSNVIKALFEFSF